MAPVPSDSYESMQYLNPAAAALCCSDQIPGREKPGAMGPGMCRGLFRGMWRHGEAYARGDVVFVCEEYEQPGSDNLYRALKTHCATDEDRPESGPRWMQFWQIRLRPGQEDNLPV